MENGSFQAPFSELSGLDFGNELPPTPQQAPRPLSTENLRAKSSTVETLLAQNEDLMARLKVTLRRLHALENQNAELQEIEADMRATNTSLADQLLVWKEKEKFWLQKNQTLEADMNAIRARFPELESMEERLERYKKYHEKIRLQVKPYIHELKAYAQNLVVEIRKLTAEIESREARTQELENRVREIRLEVDSELRRQDEQNQTLAQIFEQEKERLSIEMNDLRTQNGILEQKAQRLDEALSREDELENLVIALRRSKEEFEQDSLQRSRERDSELQNARTDLIEKRCQVEDLEKKLAAMNEDAERQRRHSEQLQEQLTSLRYLWTNKCEEVEKMHSNLQSLEKLNQELSHRLNQARKGEASL